MVTVFKHSRGIPRLINTLCENALLSGYACKTSVISPDIVEEAAHDLRLGVVALNGSDVVAQRRKEKDELLSAVKTLLELHDYLKELKSTEAETEICSTQEMPRA
jgi:general secretion pathway protein A